MTNLQQSARGQIHDSKTAYIALVSPRTLSMPVPATSCGKLMDLSSTVIAKIAVYSVLQSHCSELLFLT